MAKVVSVETIHLEDEVDVFDVEVETDASFIVGNSVLHNSGICRARAGKLWTLEGVPIGHTLPFFLCPLHWNCRSHVIAVMHAFNDMPSRLQRRIRKEDFDGKASPEPDIEAWLEIRGEKRDPGPLDYQTARTLIGL
jgi:hypothetical protein